MKINFKDVMIRCLKTFIQAAVPLILSSLSTIDFSGEDDAVESVLIAIALSACATGLCAVWNGVLNPLLDMVKIKADNKTEQQNFTDAAFNGSQNTVEYEITDDGDVIEKIDE